MYKTLSVLRVNLITYHKYFHNTKGNTNPVHILVWHSILFTMGYRMVLVQQYLLFTNVSLTKKIIGGPTFCSSIVSFIPDSIFRGDSPMIVVSPYLQG